jgi:transcriptional regulator with XRE-family HTH domain
MPGRRRRVDEIPEGQSAVIGVNVRTLRQRKGWSQAELGELMGWQSASTVCAAEGRRDGRQRGFTAQEIQRLSSIFGISPQQLTTRCVNCGGHPPAGFACLACGAAL